MDKIAYALLIAGAMGIVGCGANLAGASLITEPDGSRVVLITDSPGGNIDAFDRAFKNWSQIPGVTVEIRRWCASACTQVLSHFDPAQICLSPGSRLGFHSATAQRNFTTWGRMSPGLSAAAQDVASISTLLMYAGYPGWVQLRLSSAGSMGFAAGNRAATLSADEFWRHGYRVCTVG